MKKAFIFFLGILLLTNFISADVLSINAGGNEEIVINSDAYIEGFFSCVPTTCAKLGYDCSSWNNKCGGTINCGNCSLGYVCIGGICTSESGGSDDGGGGASGEGTISNIVINPKSINLTLSFNNQTNMGQRIIQIIYITNNGTTSQTISIGQGGLNAVAFLSANSITILPGETRELQVDFVSPLKEQDISGVIFIGSQIIPVSLHVTSNPLWFDSNIVILNDNYQVSRGGTLETRVELVPMGEKSRLDVTLNYVIKDTLGKIYLTKSETVLVSDRINFNRDFGTGMLPVGDYIIGLEVIYPGGVAPSSAHFEVVKMSAGNLVGTILFFVVLIILIVMIMIVIFLIRKKRREKEESKENINV
jgi:hypothetical protein